MTVIYFSNLYSKTTALLELQKNGIKHKKLGQPDLILKKSRWEMKFINDKKNKKSQLVFSQFNCRKPEFTYL